KRSLRVEPEGSSLGLRCRASGCLGWACEITGLPRGLGVWFAFFHRAGNPPDALIHPVRTVPNSRWLIRYHSPEYDTGRGRLVPLCLTNPSLGQMIPAAFQSFRSQFIV